MPPVLRLLAVALLLAASALPARAQSLAERLDEARLVAQVQVALAEDATLRAFPFAPAARGGVVTLAGRVETAAQRDRAAELVAGIEGVESVVNRVEVSGGGAAVAAPDLPPAPPDTAEAEGEAETEAETAPAPEPVYHTVRSGDVLGSIARRYGVTVRQIQQLNGLSGTRIRVGQRLRVK